MDSLMGERERRREGQSARARERERASAREDRASVSEREDRAREREREGRERERARECETLLCMPLPRHSSSPIPAAFCAEVTITEKQVATCTHTHPAW